MQNQKFSLACSAGWILLLLAVPGCSKTSAKPDSSESKSDDSLTSEEYIRLGLPAQDREWSGDDMVTAERLFTSLAQEGYGRLPRYKSQRSGEVFARLTSGQNLEVFRTRSLPFESRLPQALKYIQATNQILKLYLAGFLKKQVRDSELVELLGEQFRASAVMLELVDEFVPTLNKDDPSYSARMQGLEQMKAGLASVVTGGLQTLTESDSYRSGELVRLVGYMQETFPFIVPRLPPGSRAETMMRLDKMQDDPALKELQPGLAELRTKVQNSVQQR
jgi:hypothetical protein